MASFTTVPFGARLLGWASLFLSIAPSMALGTAPSVRINGTSIIGTSQASASNTTVEFFGGIPFAKPPLGELRFAPPVAIDSFGVSTLNATAFGAPCVQIGIDGISEDCLTLNVFRPSEALISDQTPVPILLWIHGGGYQSGNTSVYTPNEIIARSVSRGTPIIYVSINYRLGPFGFPQGTEAGQSGSLNLGLKDQLAAISWVQKHIREFGGDPTKITLFGQDAGAISIANLYINAGLEKYGVRGAIIESGFAESLPLFNASRRDILWDAFAANTTVCAGVPRGSTFPCLRNATTSELLTSWESAAAVFPDLSPFVPVIDGPDGLLPDSPINLIAAGQFSKIPFIAGTVLDEGTSFVPQQIVETLEIIGVFLFVDSPYPQSFSDQYVGEIETLLTYYGDPASGSPFGTGNETFGLSPLYKSTAAAFGDMVFEAPRRGWIQAAAGAGVPTYGYLFADQSVAAADPPLGVKHGAEVPYVYGFSSATENATSALVSRAMIDYWLSFAVSGTPNDGKGIPRTAWPQYTSDNEILVQFDATNLTSDLSNATFAIVPDDYRARPISFINSVSRDFAQ